MTRDSSLVPCPHPGATDGVLGTAPSAGSDDGFLARYGTTGALTWLVQFGISGLDQVTAMAIDADHAVYVTGYTTGTLPGSPTINLGFADAFLVKYDQSGTAIWTRQLGGVGDELAFGVAVDRNGDVFVAGSTTGTLIGASAGSADFFLARYDTDGNLVMLTQRGSSGDEVAFGVAVGPSGNAYVTGATDGVLGAATSGSGDLFVAKYDSAGTEVWIEQRGTAQWDGGVAIAANADGQVFVAGRTSGGLDGHVHQGLADVVVIRYDANGTWRWTDQRGTAGNDLPTAIAVGPDGTPYTAGWTDGGLDSNVNAGGHDLFVLKHGRGGAWRWTRLFGGPADDDANGIAVGGADQPYVVGASAGTIGRVANLGLDDAFAVKFSSSGSVN